MIHIVTLTGIFGPYRHVNSHVVPSRDCPSDHCLSPSEEGVCVVYPEDGHVICEATFSPGTSYSDCSCTGESPCPDVEALLTTVSFSLAGAATRKDQLRQKLLGGT